MRILVTGCPRSGTRFASRLFREVFGLMVGHENEFGDGTSDWKAVDPRYDKKKYNHIFHQVRYPLDVINSLHTISRNSILFMYRNIVKQKVGEPKAIQCARLWYYWTVEAERMAHYTYLVEKVGEALPDISDLIGIEPDMQSFHELPDDENSRKHIKSYANIIWDDIEKEDEKLYNDILRLASRLGY